MSIVMEATVSPSPSPSPPVTPATLTVITAMVVIRSPTPTTDALALSEPTSGAPTPRYIRTPQMHCDCGCQPIVEEQVVFNLDVQSQRDEAWAKNLALAAQQGRLELALERLIRQYDELVDYHDYLQNNWRELQTNSGLLAQRVADQNMLIEGLTQYMEKRREAPKAEQEILAFIQQRHNKKFFPAKEARRILYGDVEGDTRQ